MSNVKRNSINVLIAAVLVILCCYYNCLLLLLFFAFVLLLFLFIIALDVFDDGKKRNDSRVKGGSRD